MSKSVSLELLDGAWEWWPAGHGSSSLCCVCRRDRSVCRALVCELWSRYFVRTPLRHVLKLQQPTKTPRHQDKHEQPNKRTNKRAIKQAKTNRNKQKQTETNSQIPITNYQLPVTNCQVTITNYRLPNTINQQPITKTKHPPPPTTTTTTTTENFTQKSATSVFVACSETPGGRHKGLCSNMRRRTSPVPNTIQVPPTGGGTTVTTTSAS